MSYPGLKAYKHVNWVLADAGGREIDSGEYDVKIDQDGLMRAVINDELQTQQLDESDCIVILETGKLQKYLVGIPGNPITLNIAFTK